MAFTALIMSALLLLFVKNLDVKLLILDLLKGELSSVSAETTVISRLSFCPPSDSKLLFRYDSRRPTRSRLSELQKSHNVRSSTKFELKNKNQKTKTKTSCPESFVDNFRYLTDRRDRRFRSASSPLGVETSSSSSSESCDPDTETVLLGGFKV